MTDIYPSDTWERGAHPTDSFLRPEAFPTVWCPGCGIGTALYTFLEAGREAGIPPERLRVVTGIGCTGAIAGCLSIKSYSETGRSPVRAAVELKQKHPELTVGVFLNNADLLFSGAEGLREAGKRRADIIVICINNFVYAASRDNASVLTPYMRRSRDGRFELPFNLPAAACAYGAEYVARWTPLRAGWLKDSLRTAFEMKGLSVIEMISPCLIFDANSGRILDSVDRMKFYNDFSEIRFWHPVAALDLRRQKLIVLGVFRDGSRPNRGECP
jgi:2-oxoglutarate ferredoxin oxidoreductase subunit beta